MYKIVIDSCGELPEELKQDGHYETVSLELEVDGCRIKDDSTFNQLDFLRRVKESLKGPKSSCPSPEQYMDAYEGEADHVYVMDSGKVVMQGTPRSIFSQVERLKEYRLDVPQITLLAYELKRAGLDIPDGILTREELTEALEKLCQS